MIETPTYQSKVKFVDIKKRTKGEAPRSNVIEKKKKRKLKEGRKSLSFKMVAGEGSKGRIHNVI